MTEFPDIVDDAVAVQNSEPSPTFPIAAAQPTPYAIAVPIIIDTRSAAHVGALQMASLGIPVFPLHGITPQGHCGCRLADQCKHPGKHPHHLGSINDATTDVDQINRWFQQVPTLNYGVQLGRELHDSGKMLVVIDVDGYKPGGTDALDALEAMYGRLPETAYVISGAGGHHYYYWADKSISFTDTMGENIDLKVNGYVVGPGSLHASGKHYGWEGSSDLFEGQPIAELPQWVIDRFSKAAKQAQLQGEIAHNSAPMQEYEKRSVKRDLNMISASCSRAEWLKVLMALHSCSQSLDMYRIADEWSQTSPDKYDAAAMQKTWNSLNPGGGITYAHIERLVGIVIAESVDLTKLMASLEYVTITLDDDGGEDNEIHEQQAPVPDPAGAGTSQSMDIPPHLLDVPGKLGLMVGWTNATAMKPQPMFAVQAALALGSVVMGRKFCTTSENWTSLYFVNIGVSGAGKEHAKTAIERALRAANFSSLAPASEYTSDSAIDSMLRLCPTHIAIIDEFGYMLKTASHKNNTNGATARKRMMEVFGRCAGTLQPKGFSTAALKKEQVAAMGPRYVENPALTMLGMTTPTPFYEAVGSGALSDGFLNRIIIVESDWGRQPARFVERQDVPEALVEWVRGCRIKDGGDLGDVLDVPHNEIPVPVVLDFSAEARLLLTQLELRCIARMDELEMQGMAEMYSRVREISMRVSLIVAHSCESNVIEADHVQWAIDYVTYWADRAITRFADKISDNPFASLCNEVANHIIAAGKRGLTVPELAKKSMKFKGTDERVRGQVFANLASDRGIVRVDSPPPSGKGRPRHAYVAPQFNDQKQ